MEIKHAMVLCTAIFAASGCASVSTRSLTIEKGFTTQQVADILGTPDTRQFKNDDQAWQYCSSGFVNDDHLIVWFYDNRVTGTTSYYSRAFFCTSKREISWTDKPDIRVDVTRHN